MIYRSDYHFDIFKLFLLVIVLPVMWFTVLITPLISSNLSCRSLYCLSCDLQFWLPLWYLQTFLVGHCIACHVIYLFWLPLWYLQTFLVGHCIACHVIYSSDYPFDIFKLSLLVIALLVMWFTVLITPLISSNFSCWSLYCLSCDLPFWLPLWYLQTFLVGHCIACHVIYRSDYPFDIFNLFLLVIVLPVMWFTVLITPLISSNFSCWSLYCLSCELPFWLTLWYLQAFLVGHCIACHVIYSSDYPFDIFKLSLLVIALLVMWFTVLITTLISSNFSCIACHVIYRSDYHFDIFKLFLLVIVLPVMWFTVLITPLISSNFSFWSLYFLSCDLPFWLPLWYLQTFLVGHWISCHVIYRSDYPFDIFKLFLLVIVCPVMWFTVLITPMISSNFSCWSLYFLSCDITFWWRLWYLQTFLVGHCISCHVIYRSDYPFDIFKLFLLVILLPVMWFTVLITNLISSNFSCWSLYCLSCDLPFWLPLDIFKLFLLVIVFPVIWFTFWLPLWYLQTFLVGHCIACHVSYRSDYPFDIFKLFLYCLSCDLPFWLPLWYLQTFLVGHCIACHVIYRSDYPFDIFKLFLLVIVFPVMWFTVLITPLISSSFSCWSLYCLSCDLQFWLPLWYLQIFLVAHCTACHVIYRSDYPFDIFKLFLLVIVMPSYELPFWLPLWYLQTFLVGHCNACHVIYRSDYPFDIFNLFLLVIVLPVMWFTVLITPLISSNFSCWSLYCLSCELPFWLTLWYLQAFLVGHCIACHVIYSSDYPFDIFKLSLLVIALLVMWFTVLITTLISSNFSCIACHVIYRSDYHFDIFKLFLLVIVLPVMWFTVLITPLISSNFSCWSLYFLSCDLPFWLPLWYLQTFLVGHWISCHVIYRSDYPFDIFKLFLLVIVCPVMWFTVLITPMISSNFSCWSLYFLSCDITFWWRLWYLQTFLVGHCISCHVIYRSDYPFDIFKLFLLVIVLPVMWFTVLITNLISSNFSCWSLYCLSCDLPFWLPLDIFKLFLLVIVFPVIWFTFWLPLWYLQTFLVGHCIACHVSYRSDYPFDIFKLFLYCLSCDLPFWLPLWYLQTFLVGHCIACHVIYRSDYPFDIFKLFLLVIVFPVMWFTVLITPLISSNFSCWSLNFLSCDLPFWLPLWYLQTFLVGHCMPCHVIYRSDYPFDIFKLFLLVIVLPVMWFTVLITNLISSNFSCWSLYCLSCDLPFWLPLDIFKLFLLVIVFPVIWFTFWLPLWYLQTFLVGHCIACHVSYRSDYPFDIFKLFLLVIVFPVLWYTVLITPLISSNFPCWSLYCLSCDLQFWLPLWYLQTFLVGHCIACHVIYSSDYPFDIFKLFLLVIVFPVMWYTVLITPLISSNFSCWWLYFLSCDLPFWLPHWYLQAFLVGQCIACHVIYSSDYPFDIFKPFL